MTRRERLLATLQGKPVDRPAVCFYEINGFTQDATNTANPLNIYVDPSWQPLLELARTRSDSIPMEQVGFRNAPPDPLQGLMEEKAWVDAAGSHFVHVTARVGSRTFTYRSRRDPDVATCWIVEHFLKDADDFKFWLDVPLAPFGGEPDVAPFLELERKVGDAGVAMIERPNPLRWVAHLFSMEDFTIIALTEPELMHRALEKIQPLILQQTESVARALPGRLWRIIGAEIASEPYLPPHLFNEYIVRYDKPVIDAIHRHGGYARIHSHGNLRNILDHIAATGCDALDPIEPPHQGGDVALSYVRKNYGKQMVLFGNLEISDLENLPPEQFKSKIETALREGTEGEGRGFVLMPSAAPYGRKLSPLALRNYELMIEIAESWSGDVAHAKPMTGRKTT